MPRKLLSMLALTIVVFGATAQNGTCAILAQPEETTALTWYTWDGSAYTAAEETPDVATMRPPRSLYTAMTSGVGGDGRTIELIAPDGMSAATFFLDDTFVRSGWLTGTLFAVTACDDDGCAADMIETTSRDRLYVQFGDYVPEAYIAWRDSYIVSRVEDGAVGIWDEVNGFRLYTGDSVVTSRPTLTSDGRHLSVRVENHGEAGVLIGDLFDSKLWYTLPLAETREGFDDAEFGHWNVREQKFIYVDVGTAYVYNAIGNETAAVIDGVETARWVCPPRG